jgi:hypothetical protein
MAYAGGVPSALTRTGRETVKLRATEQRPEAPDRAPASRAMVDLARLTRETAMFEHLWTVRVGALRGVFRLGSPPCEQSRNIPSNADDPGVVIRGAPRGRRSTLLFRGPYLDGLPRQRPGGQRTRTLRGRRRARPGRHHDPAPSSLPAVHRNQATAPAGRSRAPTCLNSTRTPSPRPTAPRHRRPRLPAELRDSLTGGQNVKHPPSPNGHP